MPLPMSNSAGAILLAYTSGQCSPEEAADALSSADLSELGASLGAKIHQAAREILHYGLQAAEASTAQWQASFAFERERSAKDLLKHAKKALKP